MNKSELITALAEATNFTKKDSETFLTAFTDTVMDTLAKGEKVQLEMAPPFRQLRPSVSEVPRRKAAVLIPIFLDENNELSTLLTLRKVYDGIHSGQVSFPGGKFDPGETDPIQVALRECEEEVGISPEVVRVAGLLTPLYIAVSGMMVQPVVGIIQGNPIWKPDPREVERLIKVRMGELIQPEVVKYKHMQMRDSHQIEVPYYHLGNETVWGATAMILSEWISVWKRIMD